jgi:hypothetical protein
MADKGVKPGKIVGEEGGFAGWRGLCDSRGHDMLNVSEETAHSTKTEREARAFGNWNGGGAVSS